MTGEQIENISETRSDDVGDQRNAHTKNLVQFVDSLRLCFSHK